MSNTGDEAPPQIVVVGEGLELARPDSCMIGVSLNLMRDHIGDAVREVGELADVAMNTLKDAGFADIDLPTRNLTIQDWIDPQQRRVTAHIATYSFSIVVRELTDVSAVVQTLANAAGDALRIQGIAFVHADPTPLQRTARRNAVQDAKQRAEQLAEAAGLRLGAIESVHEVPAGALMNVAARTARMPAEYAAMPVNPGNQAVTVRVAVAFSILSSP